MAEPLEHTNCPKCGKPVKVDAKLCGNCWSPLEGVKETPRVRESQPLRSRSEMATLSVRYRDAYVIARKIIGLGGIVKVIGILLGVAVLLVSLGALGDIGWRVIIGAQS